MTASRFPSVARRPLRVSRQTMVEMTTARTGGGLPLLVQAKMPALDLGAWAGPRRAEVEGLLVRHGAILFRGFAIESLLEVRAASQAVTSEMIEYSERSSPRTRLAAGIYTSTDHPAHQPIALHNEQSYTLTWPTKILFCCLRAAIRGGATPLASSAGVLRRLDEKIRSRFAE